MKLRYYLRGLGVGILVTAIIMTVALSKKQPMTDAEIIKRAKELGMIENTIIKDVAISKEDSQETETEEVKEDSQETVTEDVKEDSKEAETEEVKEEIQEEQEVPSEPGDEMPEIIIVSVISGDSSWSVAKRMEEMGLVDSAKDFDTYLCGNGYDKRISVGTYEVSKNATWEEMAKIITKTK